MQAAVSRRGLLGGALALAGATTMVGGAVVTASPARAASAASVLVVVSLRGGADGLSLVVPHADPDYYAARPGIAIPPTGCWSRTACSGCTRRWPPSCRCGRPARSRRSTPPGCPWPTGRTSPPWRRSRTPTPAPGERVGWLNRLVSGTPGHLTAAGLQRRHQHHPDLAVRPAPTMSAGRVDDVELPGSDDEGRRQQSLQIMWEPREVHPRPQHADDVLGHQRFGPAQAAADNRGHLPRHRPRPLPGHRRADHPRRRRRRGHHRRPGRLGHALRHGQCRRRLDVQQRRGPRVADRRVLRRPRHPGEQGHPGDAQRVRPPGRGERQRRHRPRLRQRHVRRRRRVRGGYHGRWPGLANSYDSDLTVTTDYRQVLADIVRGGSTPRWPRCSPG